VTPAFRIIAQKKRKEIVTDLDIELLAAFTELANFKPLG
jgi:hypothetical protein